MAGPVDPGAGAEEVADASAWRPVPTFTGRRVGVALDNRADVDGELDVGLQLVRSASGHTRCSSGRSPKGQSTRPGGPFCRAGCRLDAIDLGGPATSRTGLNGVIRVTDISVDGERLDGGIEGAGWTLAPKASDAAMVRSVRSRKGRSRCDVGSGESDAVVQLAAGALTGGLPVVRGVIAGQSTQRLLRRDQRHGVRDAGSALGQSVPFVGPSGSLIDYGTLTTDRVVYQQRRRSTCCPHRHP